jgi:hypothetical protein
MASSESRRILAAAVLLLSAWSSRANAQPGVQQIPPGYAVERFYPSAPGGGWFVMDDVNIGGGLGGAISITGSYARNPLVVTLPGGTERLTLISNEAYIDVGMAVTYHRFRFYLDVPMPFLVDGHSGTLGPYQVTAPALTIGTNPDTIADSRIGLDALLLGKPKSAFRLGAGAQFIIPSGNRADYVTDARDEGMFRVLPAGDIGGFSYAGQFGVHLRPAEDLLLPGSPDGNELLFGASVGRKFSVRSGWALIVGPEFFGESAVRSTSSGQTGFEGLLTTRLEQTGDRPHLRFRVGVGHGIVEHFGAPEWRVLVGVELATSAPQ